MGTLTRSTDPGVDDLIAILLVRGILLRALTQALASPEVSLEAITLTFGNTTLDYAFGNLLRLSNALRITNENGRIENETLRERIMYGMNGKPVPVALGATKPLGGNLFTASYFHGRDGMSGVSFLPGDPFPMAHDTPLFSTNAHDLPADELILDVIRRHPPHTVRIAAVAPLTNLAQAYQKDPETFRRVGAICVMGGALEHPGNTSPVAEFNFFADPWAAKLLIEDAQEGGALPIHLLPLDITTVHTLPFSRLVREESDALHQSSCLVRLISLFLRKPRAVTNSFAPRDVPFDPSKYDLFEAHDPLAVGYAIFGFNGGWGTTQRQFQIETDGRLTRGFCVVDRRNLGDTYTGRNKADVEAQQGPTDEHGIEGSSQVENPVQRGPPSVTVVTQSPGSAWFGDMLLNRLNMK